MFYREEYRKKAHEEVDYIFRTLFVQSGLHIREAQIRLCHQMLDALLLKEIALCDAGVGIGKTYAYLVACILMRKYASMMGNAPFHMHQPVVVSTASIALQRAILTEYIPFLSKILLRHKVIALPLQAVVRKGKEHFVCDYRLEERLEAIREKEKNPAQKKALLSLKYHSDMDEVQGLSGFDRRLVCVPKFCHRECPGRKGCRYQKYLEQAKKPEIFLQICNHNYLLADTMHRSHGYRPLLTDYRALIVDEAHKLPEAAMQMYGKSFGQETVLELAAFLVKEHQGREAEQLRMEAEQLLLSLKELYPEAVSGRIRFEANQESAKLFSPAIARLCRIRERFGGSISRWIQNRLEETEGILRTFQTSNRHHVCYLQLAHGTLPILCTASRDIPHQLQATLWQKNLPAILTSGTLKAGEGFTRTRQVTGLEKKEKVREYVAESPFHYQKNCMLYLPKNIKRAKKGSREEIRMLAEQIHALIRATNGHTLVLFTSYSLMSGVYQMLRNCLPFELVEVWRHSQEEIMRFKSLDNGVLFAAGSCWEGVDFPGDMVSSLIIVKLPFAVPDPISEVEKENYERLEDYIRAIIVPDMQKKLRQGFGRAIRTEQDTCVVSILDHRALAGGRYHADAIRALPDCLRTDSIREVEAFIRERKGADYYGK